MQLERRAQLNWTINVSTVLAIVVFSVRSLLQHPWPEEVAPRASTPLSAAFHAVYAVLILGVLLLTYLDDRPIDVKYRVVGEPSIPEVQCKFVHGGKWTTFTVWSNTLSAVYFVLATTSDVLKFSGSDTMPALSAVLTILWEVIFPISFLVNIVVSLVLLPALKKGGKLDILEVMLRWKSLWLHNGFVLAMSIEAALSAPPVHRDHLPVILLYGVSYVAFSWLLFQRTRIYHYFFMDPRFKYAPVGLIGLLCLCSCLYLCAGVVAEAARSSPAVGVCTVATALATCTWRSLGPTVDGIWTGAFLLQLFRGKGSKES